MSAPGPIEPEGLFDGLSGGSIALGALVDIGATVVVGSLLLLWLAPDVFSPDEATSAEALEAFYASAGYAALQLALGMLCTVFGAYVGARRAGRLHVRHGGWIAVASTALNALLIAIDPSIGSDPAPFWMQALGWVLVIPAGIAGGALAGALDGRAVRGD